ncbi:hypothetical protein [Microbacterium sp. No. 7]|uniref:hypothetical protein n=1 Tax=Microbacterium sp. No. 7 TaxID=1714373 RepID=UPI0006D1314C|nr:hypothetical protein [Microbacterium sp. No. 7]ALJ19424.1 hypothetical protein AOA12_05685 [Microbacterium sp. No. 7]
MTGSSPRTGPLAAWRFTGTLRHYQADVLDRVDVHGDAPLHIVAPPGSGKTLLGLLLSMRRGGRAVVLTPTVAIRAQWADAAAGLVPAAAGASPAGVSAAGVSPAGTPPAAPDDAGSDRGVPDDARAGRAVPSAVPAVSQDPARLGDVTVLTYQALSVLDSAQPLAELAARRWLEELVADGRAPDVAAVWLEGLQRGNPRAFRDGIARRSRALRRSLVREDPAALAASLHPNARALVDRIVRHDVDTIVLDECHHLLDHWALVVAALVTRLRAEGRRPLVIGLTATLPSPDDADEYDNYTSLLGDVDYEVPTPAVVRDGALAPYRDLVRFVVPTADELAFLRGHAEALDATVRGVFADPGGVAALVERLQPPDGARDVREAGSGTGEALRPPPSGAPSGAGSRGAAPLGAGSRGTAWPDSARGRAAPPGVVPPDVASPGAVPPGAASPGVIPPDAASSDVILPDVAASGTVASDVDARLSRAFAADFAAAEAAAAMLATVAPRHPLVEALPADARREPTTDEALRLLARHALDRLLPDPARAAQWERVRRTLADFGYGLTDRGVRRTRDPIDTLLASSLAKDHAVCSILALERQQLGDERLRALVVTDFARHGNRQGGLVGGAGALRTFDVVVTDPGTSTLAAVLVTGSTVRVPAWCADALTRAFGDVLGVPVAATPRAERPQVCDLLAPGASTGDLVVAASALLSRGDLQVVVGTRGLFGEGWDCPAVNTLVDLTAVATASAVQQLRGRTLRLDPAWPGKVAHNWTVTGLLPPELGLRAAPDAARLRRKHERLWGLDRDDPSLVVRGLGIALDTATRADLDAVVRGDPPPVALGRLHADVPPPRGETAEQWRVGSDYDDAEQVVALVERRRREPVFRTTRTESFALGATLGAGGVTAAGAVALAIASGGDPLVTGLCGAVALAAGAVSAPVVVAWRRARGQARPDVHVRIAEAVWAGLHAAGRVAAAEPPGIAVDETPAPDGGTTVTVRCPEAPMTDQRALVKALAELHGPVRVPRFLLQTGARRGGVVGAVLRLAAGSVARRAHFLPVPTAIGRRRSAAEAFARVWERRVGACVLHELNTPAQLALVAEARRGTAARASTREQWS